MLLPISLSVTFPRPHLLPVLPSAAMANTFLAPPDKITFKTRNELTFARVKFLTLWLRLRDKSDLFRLHKIAFSILFTFFQFVGI